MKFFLSFLFVLFLFQYILGNWDFINLKLTLRPPVFIPRPETEQLVGLVLDHLKVRTTCYNEHWVPLIVH